MECVLCMYWLHVVLEEDLLISFLAKMMKAQNLHYLL